MFFSLVFWAASIFQFRSVSVSISIIWHAGLFFRSYSGNLPAMFINSREAIAAIIGDIVVSLQSKNWIGLVLCLFLQFKEFELYWGAVFFF